MLSPFLADLAAAGAAPVAFLSDLVGQFFRQFGLTIVCATLFSLFVSFTLTPALASRLLGKGRKRAEAPKEPAVPVKRSIAPDYLICLEDGRKFKSLKRHLRTKYDMSPEQYRAKWNLAKDYPMVAPNYAQARSNLAAADANLMGEITVQLDDGSALKLTVAKYYTPSHRVIHEHGIEPDIVVPMTGDQEAALLLTRLPGGLETLDATNRIRIAQIQDVQRERAEDLLKGILLYGQLQSAPAKMAAK